FPDRRSHPGRRFRTQLEEGGFLVELPQGPDRRQDRGAAALAFEDDPPQLARGAARGHIDRRPRDRERIRAKIDLRDQMIGEQRVDQRRQEWSARPDRKEARAVPHHLPPMRARTRSASSMAAGVPTVIQFPSILIPYSLPPAMA